VLVLLLAANVGTGLELPPGDNEPSSVTLDGVDGQTFEVDGSRGVSIGSMAISANCCFAFLELYSLA
jgi:hypothetical protein